MQIADILTADRVLLDVDASSKKRVLETMSELLAGADQTLSARAVFDRIIARERLGSTGLGHGVALPHGRVPQLERTIGAFLKTRDGVDFDAPDGQPVDLVFGLAVPEECTEEHLQILSQLAGAFSMDELREALRTERSADLACELMCDGKTLP